MSRFYILIILLFSVSAFAQTTSINPVITPALFSPSDEITVTYDVTGTPLASLPNAWIWVWIPGSNIDAKYNVNPASENTALTDNAKFTKSTANNTTTFSITFTPKDFFESDISSESQMGMLLKGNDWSNGQTTDYLTSITQEDQFSALLIQPELDPVFVNTNDNLAIEALSNEGANFSLKVNNVEVDVQNGITEYLYTHQATETEGIIPCELTVTNATSLEDTVISFSYIIRTATIELPRPTGIISGINYHEGDDTRATLCLLAPMKSSVFVLGEFNDFTVSPDYQMFKDGEYFWIEIDNLAPGHEYAFQ